VRTILFLVLLCVRLDIPCVSRVFKWLTILFLVRTISIVGHFKTLATYGISALTHSKTKNSIVSYFKTLTTYGVLKWPTILFLVRTILFLVFLYVRADMPYVVRVLKCIVGHFKTLTTYGISALTYRKTKNSIVSHFKTLTTFSANYTVFSFAMR
jgi:hypothetical protein